MGKIPKELLDTATEALVDAASKALESGDFIPPDKDPDEFDSTEIAHKLLEVINEIASVAHDAGISFTFAMEYAYSDEGGWRAATGVRANANQTSPLFDSMAELAEHGHDATPAALLRWFQHIAAGGKSRKVIESHGIKAGEMGKETKA